MGNSLGHTAWLAYARTVGGKTFDGKPLPEWEALGEVQKEGWEAAARAAVEESIGGGF